MIEKEYLKKIEEIFNLNYWYIVSPFLKIYPYGSDFDNLEEYFEKEYIRDYYVSIKRILFRIICYYESIVYLTGFFEGNPLKRFEKYKYQNFRNKKHLRYL